jgi:predicted nucleic acid-binding protein
LTHNLPLADSIVLATARRREATVWTQDSDFEGLEKVEYFAKTDP